MCRIADRWEFPVREQLMTKKNKKIRKARKQERKARRSTGFFQKDSRLFFTYEPKIVTD